MQPLQKQQKEREALLEPVELAVLLEITIKALVELVELVVQPETVETVETGFSTKAVTVELAEMLMAVAAEMQIAGTIKSQYNNDN
jgi:hypothetical protein